MTSSAMLYEALKKSAILSAILNLFLPGLGYMYCGKLGLGFAVLFGGLLLMALTFGLAGFIITPIVVIDGFMCAGRVNVQLADKLSKERN